MLPTFEDEESDEEYRDDVVLKEIGDNSDEDETTDTAQQSEKDDSEGDDSNDNNNSDIRELKQTTAVTATRTSLNKKFNEQNNSCARAL